MSLLKGEPCSQKDQNVHKMYDKWSKELTLSR